MKTNLDVDRETFLKVMSYIDNFVHTLPGGTSYWVDPNNVVHYTDVGYGIEFWDQIREYFENN